MGDATVVAAPSPLVRKDLLRCSYCLAWHHLEAGCWAWADTDNRRRCCRRCASRPRDHAGLKHDTPTITEREMPQTTDPETSANEKLHAARMHEAATAFKKCNQTGRWKAATRAVRSVAHLQNSVGGMKKPGNVYKEHNHHSHHPHGLGTKAPSGLGLEAGSVVTAASEARIAELEKVTEWNSDVLRVRPRC